MKTTVIVLSILLFMACSPEHLPEVQTTDLKDHNMKIIPENPTSRDQIKLVVFDDCSYNVLSEIIHKGTTIDIRKQFNSMMKWPCQQINDTILIGKLNKGTYLVNYQLYDISTQVSNPIALAFSFHLLVNP